MDPILQYLLEFNQENSIEYDGRRVIPIGGLAEMISGYKKFHLNRVEVVKSEILPDEPEKQDLTIDQLYELLG